MKCILKCRNEKWFVLGLLAVMGILLLSGCGSKSEKSSESMMTNNSPAYTNNQNANNVNNDRKTQTQQNQQSETGKKSSDTYFKSYGTNPFRTVQEEPLSTFAVDVDTASYSIARSYINSGSLPPSDAIRVEEFVNYFKRQYPLPARDTFSIYTEIAPSAFNRGYHMVEIGLQGKDVGVASIKNTSLTFVIDVSGSMNMDKRLNLVKKSLDILVQQMGGNDRIGIAVYGTNGRKLLDHTSGSNKKQIMDAINSLKPEGSTNAAEGLMIGYDMASKAFLRYGNNRVILCTDGVANEGITKAEEILKMIEDYRSKGITLTTLGFGMDNFNDVFLEKLADKGDGNYAYIDTIEEAKKVFLDQLAGTLQVIAKDVKAQVEFSTDTVESYRLIGYENRMLDSKDFNNNSVDAGEVGAGHAVTALYEIKLKSKPGENLGIIRIRYKNPQADDVSEISKQIKSSEVRSNFYDATPRFRFITMVAQTAEILKNSPWASNTSLQNVYELLSADVKNLDMNKSDSEFVELVKNAVNLKTRR